MFTLLLDSSDINLTVGILKDEKLIYSYSNYAWQRQSEYMIPEIEKALKECNITLKDINRVALGIGPGSYTGVRIPLAIAKTLYTANNVEIVPISSLKILGTSKEKYIALMNARSNRSYLGIYSNGETILSDRVVDNNDLMEIIKPYLQAGYVLKGNLKYLGNDKVVANEIEGLASYALISEVSASPKSLCPAYLKD